MKKVLSLALFVSMLVTTAVSAAPFSSQKLGVQFESPSSWDASESGGEFGSSSVFVLPADAQARTNEGTGISILTEEPWDVQLPSDLSGVLQYFKDVRAGNNSPYTIISEEDVTIGGYPAKQITYTSTYSSGEVAGKLARHREIYTYGPTRFLYNIGYSSVDATFDKYWPDAKVVIDSIKFTS